MEERGQRGRVFALAAAHLNHELVLTLCLVSALAAVLAPLLILLGLKEGTIETLRDRLVKDPVFREIRPAVTRSIDPYWLQSLSDDARVAFLTPTILPASSVVHMLGETGNGELMDLVPTAAGDPLLLENGGVIPADGECVLTSEAARRLGVAANGRVDARVTRSRGGRIEAVTESLRVAAVLTPRAGGLPRVYAPLAFVVDVEAYKEGRAVARRHWGGASASPYLSYDGVLVLTEQVIGPVALTGLVVNTGLLRTARLDGEGFTALTGLALPRYWHAYDLSVPSGSVTYSSIRALQRKLRGRGAVVLPYARDMLLRLAERELPLMGLSLTREQSRRLGWEPLPWGGLSDQGLHATRLFQLLPAAAAGFLGSHAVARFDGVVDVSFPVKLPASAAAGRTLIPVELLGMLRTARDRAVRYDADLESLVLERAGYRGFRLYADTIDAVPALVERLRDDGLEVVAEVESIRRIQVLDRGLTRLFWLIAVLGGLGAGAVLVASLYAAVERERKDLGILRLIGFSRTDVFWFPVFQGLLIAVVGVLLGGGGYLLLAGIINSLFGSELMPGQAMCRLPPYYSGLALGGTLLLALLSSLLAAWKATRIEPAEAIREE